MVRSPRIFLGIACIILGLGSCSSTYGAEPVRDSPLLERQDNLEAIAQQPTDTNFIRPYASCPEDLEALIPLLLRDLPSYANRVSQRAFDTIQTAVGLPGYVLLAGNPEYEPLTLGPGIYASGIPEESPPQVFFTTLERQYVDSILVRLQHYHWLFLVRTDDGWRLVMMYSRIGGLPTTEPPSPPEDSSHGTIAEAIRLWLRDCQTGNVNPL